MKANRGFGLSPLLNRPLSLTTYELENALSVYISGIQKERERERERERELTKLWWDQTTHNPQVSRFCLSMCMCVSISSLPPCDWCVCKTCGKKKTILRRKNHWNLLLTLTYLMPACRTSLQYHEVRRKKAWTWASSFHYYTKFTYQESKQCSSSLLIPYRSSS